MASLGKSVIACIGPWQIIAIYHLIEQSDHEVYGLLRGIASGVFRFRPGEGTFQHRQTSIKTESIEIGVCHEAAGLILIHGLRLGVHSRHTVHPLHHQIAAAHRLPYVHIVVGIDIVVAVAVSVGLQHAVVIPAEDARRRCAGLVSVSEKVGYALPVIEELGNGIAGICRQVIILVRIYLCQEIPGVFSVTEHRVCRHRAAGRLLEESVAESDLVGA